MGLIKSLSGAAFALAVVASYPGQALSAIIQWDLLDHGGVVPGIGQLGAFYGLRLDDPLPPGSNGGPDRLFSFSSGTARLFFDTANGGSASISGTIIENGDGSTAPGDSSTDDSPNDGSIWDLSYTFTGLDVKDVTNPFEGFTATGGSGTVTPISGGAVPNPDDRVTLTLGSAQCAADIVHCANLAFLWLPDGHRLAGDDESLVGRGWVDPDYPDSTGANDFLFQGTVVPIPAALPLFLGALASLGGLGYMKRRRSSVATV